MAKRKRINDQVHSKLNHMVAKYRFKIRVIIWTRSTKRAPWVWSKRSQGYQIRCPHRSFQVVSSTAWEAREQERSTGTSLKWWSKVRTCSKVNWMCAVPSAPVSIWLSWQTYYSTNSSSCSLKTNTREWQVLNKNQTNKAHALRPICKTRRKMSKTLQTNLSST